MATAWVPPVAAAEDFDAARFVCVLSARAISTLLWICAPSPIAIREVAISPRTSPVEPISTRSRPRNAPNTFPRMIISRASTSAEILPCGPTVTRPVESWIVPCTSPSMYKSSLPRTSPLISRVEVMIPPEGCTTSAVNPATLRMTGSTRGGGATGVVDAVDAGAGVGTSAAGAAGFESSGLRHIGFFPRPKTP
jgi:hypothetical protein